MALGTRLSLALAHVHHNGIVHRDIKPSNIVLDAQGAPHLADFGIALLLDAARMTSSNEIMGTAAYLSPEQIIGAEVGAAADIYSLGLVLLECLTRRAGVPRRQQGGVGAGPAAPRSRGSRPASRPCWPSCSPR